MNLDYFQVSFLAILQGFTEFLPISSSGHLILPTLLFGWEDQGLTFDVAVHIGSLAAVLIFFQRDVTRLLHAWLGSIFSQRHSSDSRLAWMLFVATIPAGLAGLLLGNYVEQYARSLPIIAAASWLFAGLLFWADRGSKEERSMDDLSWKAVIFIGLAQALALIPGTSRSGVTMTAALFCHLDRKEAARFSFLLSIPIIMASGLLRGADLISAETVAIQWPVLIYSILLSAAVAYLCIHYFLQLIERIGFLPFVLYRMVLGLLLIGVWLV